MLLENIYSTGDTNDDQDIFIVQASTVTCAIIGLRS
jgi:hypothetical protein